MKTSLWAWTLRLVATWSSSRTLPQPEVSGTIVGNDTGYIVGGTGSGKGRYPFYAFPALGGILCGATLIHEDILITTAHCNGPLYSFLPTKVNPQGGTVHIGASRIDGSDAIDTIGVQLIRLHPRFNKLTYENDYALLKLASPSKAPIAKLNTNSSLPGPYATVTTIGFGNTEEGGFTSRDLLHVNVSMIEFSTCREYFGRKVHKGTMMCAYGNGKDSCQGDSGGPLLTADGKTLVVSASDCSQSSNQTLSNS
jgi:trypsin